MCGCELERLSRCKYITSLIAQVSDIRTDMIDQLPLPLSLIIQTSRVMNEVAIEPLLSELLAYRKRTYSFPFDPVLEFSQCSKSLVIKNF